MKTRIVVVSPTSRIVPDVAEAFAALWPDAECSQLVDDTIYQDVFYRGTGLTPEIEARVLALLRHGETAGADAMMFTGSVFGALIEQLRIGIGVPVVTSSEGLIEEAFAAGRRFGILSTVRQSIDDLVRDMRRHAERDGVSFTTVEHVEAAARPLFETGVRDRHDAMLAAASLRPEFGDVDVLILPQFSLTSAHRALPVVDGRPALCASRSSIGLLKRLTAARGA
jgi:Asp/Glu/hydantoin racemase